MLSNWTEQTMVPAAFVGTERCLELTRASEQLQLACDRMLALDRAPALPAAQLLHATAACLHTFAQAVTLCEQAGVERSEISAVAAPVRALHATSPFVKRLQRWPRGYAGDFETIEWMCDATNRAALGTAGWAIEQYALHSPIAQQHRNKVGLQARAMLGTVLRKRDARIASIGCGGCRDLALIQDYVPEGAGQFALVDGDADALAFARRRLARISDRCRAIHGRVPRALKSLQPSGPYDLIVAGGLFDYLPDRWAIATLRECRGLLAPEGRLLFSNLARGNPFRTWLEYLADWTLIERDHDDILRLLHGAGFHAGHPTIFSDSTGLALIVDVWDGPRRKNDWLESETVRQSVP